MRSALATRPDARGYMPPVFDIRQFLRENNYRQIGMLRFKNPHVPNMEETINQPYYDSASFAQAAAFTKTTLFSTPIGQGGKTLAQTNMTQANVLPNPQRLYVTALRVFIGNDTAPVDLNNMLRNVSITITVGKKPMFEGFLGLLTAGCGGIVTAASNLGTALGGAAPVFTTSNGHPDQRNVYSLTQPFPIDNGENISTTLFPETAFNFAAAGAFPAGVGSTFYVIFDGDLYRGVQ